VTTTATTAARNPGTTKTKKMPPRKVGSASTVVVGDSVMESQGAGFPDVFHRLHALH
jgi:hypothetical protein